MIEFDRSSRDKLSHEQIRSAITACLTLPSQIKPNNPNQNLPQKLGLFLAEKDCIQKIDVWRNSWGCKYGNNKISINELPMPTEQYNYYIFRLGKNSATGENLFPKPGDETDQYRFLHETSHAYQKYLMQQESPVEPTKWYEKVLSGEIVSELGILFEFCYQKRTQNPERGLSTWGNVPDYNAVRHAASRNAVRAIEDANELITMTLWHPEYLKTFLDYVAGKIPGYGEQNLKQDGLIKITDSERNILDELIERYITEMRSSLNSR